MLKANAVILAIVDLCRSRAAVKDTLCLARHGLREVTKTIPLTTLLYTIVSFRRRDHLPPGLTIDLRGFIE